MGEALSVLDIAWLIYAHRLSLAATRSSDCIRTSLPGRRGSRRGPNLPRRLQAAGKTLEAVAGF
jgi:hypothetical protein